jgi:MFS family permease
MASRDERLFTPRFFMMCGFTFTVFLSAFQLLPTVPFRILEQGGSHAAAGLFLGLLTYSSAFTAPFTGALADRFGRRPTLLVSSLALTLFSIGYALSRGYVVLLVIVVFHGAFWSALLSASAAYMMAIIPEHRRAEGIGYWGMATIIAVAVAPTYGLWAYQHGWVWLCSGTALLHLVMAAMASRLPPSGRRPRAAGDAPARRSFVEWRILGLSFSLFLYSFGYGAINSFVVLFADARGITPRGVYFTTFAAMTLIVRVFSGPLADRIGYRQVFLPCLVLIAAGLGLLAVADTRASLIASGVVFGLGFGAAYPIYVAHVMRHVPDAQRGAAFGAILAAFDTGIGSGSIVSGILVGRWGYATAFGAAAALSALSLPYFLFAERRWLRPAN